MELDSLINLVDHRRGITRLGLKLSASLSAGERSSRSRLHFQRSECVEDLEHEPWVLVVLDGRRRFEWTENALLEAFPNSSARA